MEVSFEGAGHFVPADKPREILQILANFLAHQANYSHPASHVSVAPSPPLHPNGGSPRAWISSHVLVSVSLLLLIRL